MRSGCAALLAGPCCWLCRVRAPFRRAGRADAADQAPLGEFIPASPPRPAPQGRLYRRRREEPSAFGDFAGKLVLVNLWATWCAPCRREMPSLERLQTRLGDKITILAISEDCGGSKAVAPFVAKLGLKAVKTYLDPKSAVGQRVQGRRAADQLSDRPAGPGARPGRRRGGMGFAQDAGGHRSATDRGRDVKTSLSASTSLRNCPPRRSPSSSIEWPMPGQVSVSTGTPARCQRGFGRGRATRRERAGPRCRGPAGSAAASAARSSSSSGASSRPE